MLAQHVQALEVISRIMSVCGIGCVACLIIHLYCGPSRCRLETRLWPTGQKPKDGARERAEKMRRHGQLEFVEHASMKLTSILGFLAVFLAAILLIWRH